MERLATNLRRLRQSKGLDRAGLVERAGLSASGVWRLEGEGANGLRTTNALKLAAALDISLDQLVEGIFWIPGQVLRNAEAPLPAERLSGFFLVLPATEAAFEPGPQLDPVSNRHEAASVLGANLREARERRHLTQRALARASNLSKDGLALIERGVNETTIERLLALACSLNLPPGRLLDGIRVEPQPSSQRCAGRPHRPMRTIESDVLRLWNEGRPAPEIAETLGISRGTISSTVHRLRERGERVPYRRPPTRAVQERARRRREACAGASADAAQPMEPQAVDIARVADDASNDAIATRIGANMAHWREEAGVVYRELCEATEVDHAHLFRAEKGRSGVPNLTFVLKLAGSLNLPASFITAGVTWNRDLGAFRVEDSPAVSRILPARLGLNAMRARHRLDLSQQALGDRAGLGRSEVSAFERGSRDFRVFALVRLSAALDVSFDELFEGVANWHFRPLPPPEYLPGERPTKRERDRLVTRLWNQGRPELEIAEALDLPPNSVSPYIRELRDAGEDLPYRRPPRNAAEVAARRRRHGSFTGQSGLSALRSR